MSILALSEIIPKPIKSYPEILKYLNISDLIFWILLKNISNNKNKNKNNLGTKS